MLHSMPCAEKKVYFIYEQTLSKRYSYPNLNALELLGIDETSIGKDHNFITVVLDLVSKAAVFAGTTIRMPLPSCLPGRG
jgi:hypothetical protein